MLIMVLVFMKITWNLKSICKPLSITTEVMELYNYKLRLVSVQEIIWDKVGAIRAEDYIFSVEKEPQIFNSDWNLFHNTE
jgi:hypothetical protein